MVKKDKNALENESSKKRIRSGRIRRRANVEDEPIEDETITRRSSRRKKSKHAKKDLKEEKEISQGRLWLSQNWKTVMFLLFLFLFALFLRSYYYYPPATEDGFILSGNDPYYHKRVADYVQENHHHLVHDPLLSYPDGKLNPRPPMFDWSIAISGLLFSPFFGGDVEVSTWIVIEFSPAFWGALTVIPVYLVGKEMFNRKTGLMAAFLIAVMPSHVERSPLGFSDHDAIALFFVVLAFFFFIRALELLKVRDRWVENWRHPKDIGKGLKQWFRYNQKPVAFSLLAGLSLTCIALTWKGYLYPVIIIVVYLFIQLILNKLKNKDSLGVALCTIITLVLVTFLPVPYYLGNRMPNYVITATEIFLAVFIISAILVSTRDSPWLFVFPFLGAIIASGLILIIYIFPDIGASLFSGQGYFAENKIFSTIAEAQAPDYSRLVFSYGVVTTFLALFAVLLSIIRVTKDLKAHYLFITIWGVTGVYMAITATRFIFNAGPIFAILSGWIVIAFVEKLDFRKMLKSYRGLKGGGRFYAMKRSVKVRHIVGVLFLVFMIILPNVWLGWDAGVPYGEKKPVDVAVYDALPWFMRPEEYDSDLWSENGTDAYPDGVNTMYNRTDPNKLKYFGAFGHGFPQDYWLDAMEWLSEQDQELPIEERPAFISWWDYGFWAIYLGQHPTAADNFQGKVQFAGSFISAQGEEQGISLMIARILETDRNDYRQDHGKSRLHDEVRDILVKYFGQEKADEIEHVVAHPDKYKSEVLDNPDRYGHYSSDMVPRITTLYAVLQTWIPELLDDDERVWLLHDLQEETGYCMRYFAIDSRLFPFGALNTGIFYAPLKLSDHRINDFNEPYDFIRNYAKVEGQWKTMEQLEELREDDPNTRVEEYELRYAEPFLDSMLMKCYIGYTLEDIGAPDPNKKGTDPDLPSVHTSEYPPMQGWMMKHFQLVYRTMYWNPYNQSEYQKHPDAWEALSEKEATERNEELGGTISSGVKSGVVFLKYYEGAYLNGTITTYYGTPVPNIRVTVSDDYGIPHDSVLTDENGTYSLIAPAGNVSVSVTTGGLNTGEYAVYNWLYMREITGLNITNINITDDQVMRRNVDEDGDGIWDYNIVQDFKIESSALNGRIFWDNDGNDEFNEGVDINISDAKVTLVNEYLEMEYSNFTADNGSYLFDDLMSGIYNISIGSLGHNITLNDSETFTTGEKKAKDIGIRPAGLYGKINTTEGVEITLEKVLLLDKTNETTITTNTDSEGNYTFNYLLPGNYTVSIDLVGFEPYSEEITLEQGNTPELNIILTQSTNIQGTTYDVETGLYVANVTLKFEGLHENEELTKITKSNETGFYSSNLRNGRYRIMVRHELGGENPYFYMGEIEVAGGIFSHDIPLQRTTEIYGLVYYDEMENGTLKERLIQRFSNIVFQGDEGQVSLISNGSAKYRTFLPPGNYTVYCDSGLGGTVHIYSFIDELSVPHTKRFEFNISLMEAKTLPGFVSYDVNKNDFFDQGLDRALSYAQVSFTDEDGVRYNLTSDLFGQFVLNLPMDKNYKLEASYFGFPPYSLDFMNVSTLDNENLSRIRMSPLNITVTGATFFNYSFKGDVNITFTAVPNTGSLKTDTTSNSSDGSYSIELAPGDYLIFIDQNTTELGKPVRYLYEEFIHIDVGQESQVYDINLTQRVKISGTINLTTEDVILRFEPIDEEGRTELVITDSGNFTTYLTPGEYNVWVEQEIGSKTYVYLNTFNFLESEILDLNLSIGVKVDGETLYDGDGKEVTITFKNNGTREETSDGDYEIFLPPNRTYEVVVNETVVEGEQELMFTYHDNWTINASITKDIELTEFLKVKGQTYIDLDDDQNLDSEEIIDNITIRFENGGNYKEVTTNSSGYYETFLEFDLKYNITFSSDFAIVDKGETINIKNEDNFEFDFAITPANLTVSGKARMNQTNESYTTIWFWAESESAIDNSTQSIGNGDFSLNLTYGDYTVYARKVSGPDVLVYLGNIEIWPREDLTLDLNLTRGVKVSGFTYILNSTNEILRVNASIEFQDEIEFNIDANENGQFEEWLPSGNYFTTAYFSTKEYNMTMNYEFEERLEFMSDKALYLNLTKAKVYDVEIEWVEGAAANIRQNENFTYNISVNNTGNLEETFDISITGPSWNFTFPYEISLGIKESKTFEVQIQTSPVAIVEHDEIIITATSKNHPETKDDVEVKVNINPEPKALNLTVGDKPPVATENSLKFILIAINMGNGEDTFNFSFTDVPSDWNATLEVNNVTMVANELMGINLTVNLSYDSTIREGSFILKAVSSHNLITEVIINVTAPNLDIGDADVKITGEDVTQGEIDTSPIPGFESLFLIISLLAVAIMVKRRKPRRDVP